MDIYYNLLYNIGVSGQQESGQLDRQIFAILSKRRVLIPVLTLIRSACYMGKTG